MEFVLLAKSSQAEWEVLSSQMKQFSLWPKSQGVNKNKST